MATTKYQVMSTMNYDRFKRLEGNRDVTDMRVNRIKKSIQKVGYIHNPIVVNEQLEVIDGQGRLQALKELGLPIEYVIAPGAGIAECREMNINMSNWTLKDYVQSWAELGDINYMYLSNLLKRFPQISMRTILFAVHNKVGSKAIANGDFECTAEEYTSAIDALEFVESIKPYLGNMRGSMCLFMNALIFIFTNEDCDMDRLKSSIEKHIDKFGDCATIEQSLEYIEKYYNRYNHSELANFVYDYKASMRARGKNDARGNRQHNLKNRYGIVAE